MKGVEYDATTIVYTRNDTDMTACIAGGLAGIHYGEQGIPERWRAALNGRAIIEDILERLAPANIRIVT